MYMALADGESRLRCAEPTLHTRTAMAVAEKLTSARFMIDKSPQEGGHQRMHVTIRCLGAAVPAGGGRVATRPGKMGATGLCHGFATGLTGLNLNLGAGSLFPAT